MTLCFDTVRHQQINCLISSDIYRALLLASYHGTGFDGTPVKVPFTNKFREYFFCFTSLWHDGFMGSCIYIGIGPFVGAPGQMHIDRH